MGGHSKASLTYPVLGMCSFLVTWNKHTRVLAKTEMGKLSMHPFPPGGRIIQYANNWEMTIPQHQTAGTEHWFTTSLPMSVYSSVLCRISILAILIIICLLSFFLPHCKGWSLSQEVFQYRLEEALIQKYMWGNKRATQTADTTQYPTYIRTSNVQYGVQLIDLSILLLECCCQGMAIELLPAASKSVWVAIWHVEDVSAYCRE